MNHVFDVIFRVLEMAVIESDVGEGTFICISKAACKKTVEYALLHAIRFEERIFAMS